MSQQRYELIDITQTSKTIELLNKLATSLDDTNKAEYVILTNLTPKPHPNNKLSHIQWSEMLQQDGWKLGGMLSNKLTKGKSQSSTYEQYSKMYDINSESKLKAALLPNKIKELEYEVANAGYGVNEVLSDSSITHTEALFIVSGLNPLSIVTIDNDRDIIDYITTSHPGRKLSKCPYFENNLIATKDFISWATTDELILKDKEESNAEITKRELSDAINTFLTDVTEKYTINSLSKNNDIASQLTYGYSNRRLTTFIIEILPKLPDITRNKIDYTPK